jgi:hypothetical protein
MELTHELEAAWASVLHKRGRATAAEQELATSQSALGTEQAVLGVEQPKPLLKGRVSPGDSVSPSWM